MKSTYLRGIQQAFRRQSTFYQVIKDGMTLHVIFAPTVREGQKYGRTKKLHPRIVLRHTKDLRTFPKTYIVHRLKGCERHRNYAKLERALKVKDVADRLDDKTTDGTGVDIGSHGQFVVPITLSHFVKP